MKKFLSLLTIALIALTCTANTYASVLSPEQALGRLNQSRRIPSGIKVQASALKLAKTVYARNSGQAALYRFDYENGNGFLLLSADDALPALLGYSDNASMLNEDYAPGFAWMLDHYSSQIELMRENNLAYTTRAGEEADDWEPISPLVKSQWDQNAPFNNNAPATTATGTRRSASGCVATALSQILYYYKYPVAATGICSATWAGGTITANLDTIPLKWDNMLDKYERNKYNNEQAKAVADLMYACGLSVGSTYASTTLASTRQDVIALCSNFGYSKSLRYYYRDYTPTEEEWEELVYGSLTRQCPVIYAGGEEDGGGHSFICDGYQGMGYFHINWGWGGDSDGYYLLNLLNPKTQGTGGTADGYNDRQYIITDIKPATAGDTAEYQTPIFYYNGDFVYDEVNTKFMGSGTSNGKGTGFYNKSPYEAKFYFGIYIVDSEGNGSFKMKDPKTYAYSKGTTAMTFSTIADLSDGVYRIYPIYYANDDQTLTYMYHDNGTNDHLIFTISNHVITNVEKGYSDQPSGSGVDVVYNDSNAMRFVLMADGIRLENISEPTEFNLYSVTGEKLISSTFTEESVTSLSALPAGIYIATATSPAGTISLKLYR